MKKLICLDMDGVIFEADNFWSMLHEELGTKEQAKPLEEKYLKEDASRLAEEVIGKLWKGKDAERYYRLIKDSRYNPGAKEACAQLRKKGYSILLLTAGPLDLALRAQEDLGIEHVMANEILIEDGIFNGKYRWLIDPNNKAEVLADFCLVNGFSIEEVVVVGDNEEDIPLFSKAGHSIAFNSKSDKLKKAADAVIDSEDLRMILEELP